MDYDALLQKLHTLQDEQGDTAMRAHLRSLNLSMDQLLEIASIESGRLLALAEQIPLWIQDSLEKNLPTDVVSAEMAQAALTRIRRQ